MACPRVFALAAANEARDRVRKAYMQMDEIDRDAGLSADDKYRQLSNTAAQAIADFEASRTLARAPSQIRKRTCLKSTRC